MYKKEDVFQFVESEDVRFIRLTFFDIFGTQKNISILPDQLRRAFAQGIAVDAFAIHGFDNDIHGDLYLHPDASTFSILPWRSTDGTVVILICDIRYPDGTPFEKDPRHLLKKAEQHARNLGIRTLCSTEFEFYLLQDGKPLDQGTYLDVSPLDHGENVRREICFSLQEMDLQPQASYHQSGPGQNEIDFHASPALRAADEASLFKFVVKAVASLNGLEADFRPKPLEQEAGNGMHINMQLESAGFFEDLDPHLFSHFLAGILARIREITLFANPSRQSYERLGKKRAPAFISWSNTNRYQLVRVPSDHTLRLELRSPDCLCSPYLVFALLIEAGLEGIEQQLELADPIDMPLEQYRKQDLERLPASLEEAVCTAETSDFIHRHVPADLLAAYCETAWNRK